MLRDDEKQGPEPSLLSHSTGAKRSRLMDMESHAINEDFVLDIYRA
jgi:hypothetical protein